MATEAEMRAEQARQLLDNPVFKQAFYPLQVAVIDDIKATGPEEDHKRNQLALKLQVMAEFEENLLTAIDDLRIEERPQDYQPPNLM